MREIKKRTIPASERDQIFVKCSFCGVEASNPQSSEKEVEWKRKGRFGVAETGIFMRTGDSYPEGGSGNYLVIHACVDCFKTKVIPVLETCALEGVKFQEVEWDW